VPLARILSTGYHVPARVVTNRDLEQMMDTTDEWIRDLVCVAAFGSGFTWGAALLRW
jgi:3-oxoacyl-[acyl-carrier-protein] synthase III